VVKNWPYDFRFDFGTEAIKSLVFSITLSSIVIGLMADFYFEREAMARR
jgi:hypothetical protein